MENNYGILFIHGAGLGSFIWDGLIPMLNIPALAIDFPNRNSGDKANADLTFHAYTKSVIDQIEKWDKNKLILVVHSIGGCVGLKVAEHFENSLVCFIAISAAIPLNNHSFASCLPFPKDFLMPVMLKLFGTKPSKKTIEKDLCNDLTIEQTKRVVDNFTPEAKQLYIKKISYKKMDVETLYIKLTKDKSIPLLVQNKMANNLNAAKIETIESGHLPMLSSPKKLSGILNRFIAEITTSR